MSFPCGAWVKAAGGSAKALRRRFSSATALRLKSAHPGALLLSCANGYEGYLPTKPDYPAGGYESSPRAAFLVPGAAERLLALAIRGIDRLQDLPDS